MKIHLEHQKLAGAFRQRGTGETRTGQQAREDDEGNTGGEVVAEDCVVSGQLGGTEYEGRGWLLVVVVASTAEQRLLRRDEM